MPWKPTSKLGSANGLLVKALVWRFFISIPVCSTIAYLYIGSLTETMELTIVLNVVATVLYYWFDRAWQRLSSKV